MRIQVGIGAALLLSSAWALSPRPEPLRWYRGNTHTHTLWSDGDASPDLVAHRYQQAGYDFLVLSDHNLLLRGERWFPVYQEGGVEKRLQPRHVAELRGLFGEDQVRTRQTEERQQMRLPNLEELRDRFERPGEFLLIEGEEVTNQFEGKPIHVNALNLGETVYPPEGGSVGETLRRTVDAIAEHGRATGRPVLAHVNHPNFGWALDWRDLAAIAGDRFFEVYNGHPSVRTAGDSQHISIEEMWDRALTLRLTALDLPLLYGIASDDAHNYHDQGPSRSNPERGWVVVRSASLTAGALIEAMGRGDFYASSGVVLKDVLRNPDRLEIQVRREAGVQYTVHFIGTLRETPDKVGETLAEITMARDQESCEYSFSGEELYIRAVIVSDRLHPNPYAAGDLEMAWVQPVQPGR